MSKSKSKKEIYENYLKIHDLESLISEMTNSVVHSQAPNPIIYMIKYLTGLLTEEERIENDINILPPYPQGFPIVRYPSFQSKNVLKKYLTKDSWYTYKHKKTSYNNDINNITYLTDHSKSDKIGLALVDNNCIATFGDLLQKIIYEVHQIPEEQQSNPVLYKVGNSPKLYKNNIFFYDDCKSIFEKIQFIHYRNIEGYTYNNCDKRNSKLKTEIETEIQNWIDDGLLSKDITKITNIEQFIEQNPIISKEYIWMKEAGLINKNYTIKDRAIYSNTENSLIILINFSNHFEIISTITDFNNNNLINSYNQVMHILKQASVRFSFDVDKKFGYLTSDISLLGGGFKIIAELKIKNQNNFIEKIKTFDRIKAEVENELIILSACYMLKDEDITKFLGIFFMNIYLCILVSKDSRLKLDLSKHKFKNAKAPLALAYDSTFNNIKKQMSFKGSNINDLMQIYFDNEDDKNFILNSSECYYLFSNFIKKYIEFRDEINLEVNGHLSKPEDPRDVSNIESKTFISKVVKFKVIISRNISGFPFPTIKNFNSYREKAEKMILEILDELNKKKQIGTYYNFKNASEIYSKNNIDILQKDEFKKYGFDDSFPENRGIIVFDKPHLFATINDLNHINFILSYTNPTTEDNIGEGMENLINIINTFSNKINFSFDLKFGFHTAEIKYVGAGMKIEAELKSQNSDLNHLDEWAKGKGIKLTKVQGEGENSVFKLENVGSFGKSEIEMLCDWLFYLSNF